MGFDAPGSAEKPGVWLLNSLVFLPVLASVALLVMALLAFRSGDYARSVRFGAVFGLAVAGGALYWGLMTFRLWREGPGMAARVAADRASGPVSVTR